MKQEIRNAIVARVTEFYDAMVAAYAAAPRRDGRPDIEEIADPVLISGININTLHCDIERIIAHLRPMTMHEILLLDAIVEEAYRLGRTLEKTPSDAEWVGKVSGFIDLSEEDLGALSCPAA